MLLVLLHCVEHLKLNDCSDDCHNHDARQVRVEHGVDVANSARFDLVDKHVLVRESACHDANATHCHVSTDE